jgi:lipid-binding SYLF domain-containing protein
MKILSRFVVLSVFFAWLSGCAAPGASNADRREHIDNMAQQALRDLNRINPSARREIDQAAGYAVFSNVSVSVVFLGGGSGYGVVEDQRDNKRIYMKMAEGGVGLGMGAKDYRLILVFNNAGTMKRFITEGWTFGVDADAAARSDKKGGAAAAEMVVDSIRIYQITEAGLMLDVSMKGAKFWTDDELNGNAHRAPVEDNGNAAPSSSSSPSGATQEGQPIPVW